MIDSGRMLIDFGNLLGRHRDLHRVLKEHGCEDALREACETCADLAGVRATLPAIHRERPDLYEYGMFCAALSLPLSEELEYPAEQRGHLFMAALLQDCGQLALSGQAAALAHELHPVAGREILTKLEDIPPVVAELVLNHHERYDGTGFPEGRLEPNLQTAQLALSVLNDAVRIRLAEAGNRNLANCPPVLRFNQGHQFTRECRALLRVLASPALTPGADWTDNDAGSHIDRLLADTACLGQWLQLLKPMSAALGQVPLTPTVARFRLLAQNLPYSADSSGIVHESMCRWAEYVRDQELAEHYPELEEVTALQRELFTQLERVLDFMTAQADARTSAKLLNVQRAMQKLAAARTQNRGDGDVA